MGSGVSAHHKNSDSDPANKSRFTRGSSKARNLSNREEAPNNGNPVAQFGSKEETFFDSQAWLESDCDEDFLSVNGDFTPARGSTPNHRSSFTESPRLSQSHFMDRTLDLKTETSPTDKKKKLSELLRESLGGDDEFVGLSNGSNKKEDEPTNVVVFSNSTNETPHLSKSNSVRSTTPNRYFKSPKEKSNKASQCCLPSLLTSLSFSERKNRLSPAQTAGE